MLLDFFFLRPADPGTAELQLGIRPDYPKLPRAQPHSNSRFSIFQRPRGPTADCGGAGFEIVRLGGCTSDERLGRGVVLVHGPECGNAAKAFRLWTGGHLALNGNQSLVELDNEVHLVARLIPPVPEAGCGLLPVSPPEPLGGDVALPQRSCLMAASEGFALPASHFALRRDRSGYAVTGRLWFRRGEQVRQATRLRPQKVCWMAKKGDYSAQCLENMVIFFRNCSETMIVSLVRIDMGVFFGTNARSIDRMKKSP